MNLNDFLKDQKYIAQIGLILAFSGFPLPPTYFISTYSILEKMQITFNFSPLPRHSKKLTGSHTC